MKTHCNSSLYEGREIRKHIGHRSLDLTINLRDSPLARPAARALEKGEIKTRHDVDVVDVEQDAEVDRLAGALRIRERFRQRAEALRGQLITQRRYSLKQRTNEASPFSTALWSAGRSAASYLGDPSRESCRYRNQPRVHRARRRPFVADLEVQREERDRNNDG